MIFEEIKQFAAAPGACVHGCWALPQLASCHWSLGVSAHRLRNMLRAVVAQQSTKACFDEVGRFWVEEEVKS